MSTNLQPTAQGPTGTSPSTSSFTTDPTGTAVNGVLYAAGPGYPMVRPPCGNAQVPTAGMPVANVTVGIPGGLSVATVAEDIYNESQAGNCPNLEYAGFGMTTDQSGTWELVGGSAVFVASGGITQSPGGGPSTPGYPGAIPTLNPWQVTNNELITEAFLATQNVGKGPQQGSPALNAPVVCGGLPAAAQQSYRWE
jgi:hypothetical protein